MEKLTKELSAEDIQEAVDIAKRIHRLFTEEYPKTTAFRLACAMHIIQTKIKDTFGIEVFNDKPVSDLNN